MTSQVLLLTFALFALGCAGTAKSGSSSSAVQIRLKGEPGDSFQTQYYSISRIQTFSDNQLLRDRTEAVDFTVQSEIQSFDPKYEVISFSSTTTRKDGAVRLHDLAFPEKGEVIDYVIKNTGEVFRAGTYPTQSIFYVPSMPIPKDPVAVGDTWTLEHVWSSARDGIPLKLNLVAILKGMKSCKNGNTCADIEISGNVKLVVAPDVQGAKFESRVWGRMLFDLGRGDVVWSKTRGREEMITQKDRVLVSSCMISRSIEGKSAPQKLACEPKDEVVESTPH